MDMTGGLFALGFRPLYLLGGGYAALGVAAWGLQYTGLLPRANPLWHAHEMLLGYAFALLLGIFLKRRRDEPLTR